MSSRRLLLTLFFIVLLVFLARPSAATGELRRIWARRDYTIKVLAAVIAIYFLYGLYQLWSGQGW